MTWATAAEKHATEKHALEKGPQAPARSLPFSPYSFKKSTAYWAASMEPRTSTDSSGS